MPARMRHRHESARGRLRAGLLLFVLVCGAGRDVAPLRERFVGHRLEAWHDLSALYVPSQLVVTA